MHAGKHSLLVVQCIEAWSMQVKCHGQHVANNCHAQVSPGLSDTGPCNTPYLAMCMRTDTLHSCLNNAQSDTQPFPKPPNLPQKAMSSLLQPKGGGGTLSTHHSPPLPPAGAALLFTVARRRLCRSACSSGSKPHCSKTSCCSCAGGSMWWVSPWLRGSSSSCCTCFQPSTPMLTLMRVPWG